MRVVIFVLLLTGCERRGPVPSPAVEARLPPPSDAAVVVTIPVDAPGADAAPPSAPDPPGGFETAPARITRRVETGMAVPRHDAETFTLQIAGGRALLTSRRERGVPAPGESPAMPLDFARWEHVSTSYFVGTATVKGKTTKLDLADAAGTALVLDCATAKLAVARAGARRVPGPPPSPGDEQCGDPGRWDRAGTRRIDVLRCKLPADFDRTRKFTSMPSLSFAAPPGIEWLYVNDDCAMQGGDWRQIPSDGSIAQIRDLSRR